MVVHRNKAPAIGLHTHLLQPQIFSSGNASGGHQAGVHLQGFNHFAGLAIGQLNYHRVAGSDLLGDHPSSRFNIAGGDQHPLGDLGNVRIEGGHQLIQRFDDGDLTAQGRVDIRELQADVAAADNGDPVGQPVELQGLVAGEDGFAVSFNAGGHKGHRARRQNNVFGRHNFFAVGGGDRRLLLPR